MLLEASCFAGLPMEVKPLFFLHEQKVPSEPPAGAAERGRAMAKGLEWLWLHQVSYLGVSQPALQVSAYVTHLFLALDRQGGPICVTLAL